jgi:hypothetical protein
VVHVEGNQGTDKSREAYYDRHPGGQKLKRNVT